MEDCELVPDVIDTAIALYRAGLRASATMTAVVIVVLLRIWHEERETVRRAENLAALGIITREVTREGNLLLGRLVPGVRRADRGGR